MIDIHKLASKLEGLQTINTICQTLNVKKSTAYEYVSLLKKGRYAKEYRRTSMNKRIYRIRRIPFKESELIMKRFKDTSKKGIFDIINENSPLKLEHPFKYRVQRKDRITIEETIIESIKTKKFRVILASLALFNKIESWTRLYYYAKIFNVQNIVGALYDLTKRFIRVKKMDLRTRNALLKYRTVHRVIIPNIKSPDFEDIQKLWNVDIPFRIDDIARLKWRA